MNARSAAEGLAESKDPELAPLQAMMINVALPVENFKREPGKPVVFFTGDSTVKMPIRMKTACGAGHLRLTPSSILRRLPV